MKWLQNLPVTYKGELHNVRLVNFSVDKTELEHMVPKQLKVRDFNGRAMISMVSVELRNMSPSFLPVLRFGYRHIAFRLLIDDSSYNNGLSKGIYFLRSFTDKNWVALAGQQMTIYNLEHAQIEGNADCMELKQGNKYISYQLQDHTPAAFNPSLKDTIQAIDRAYAVVGDTVKKVQIVREKWPIEWVECTEFKTNFFRTARFEGAFKVAETIYYKWLPLQTVKP